MTTIRTLVCAEPRHLHWQDRPQPTLAADSARLNLLAAGICGTDIHAWGGNQPFFSYPRVLGHELCGEIVALGSTATGLRVGQRVAVIPYLACGACDACQSGKPNCCEALSVIGVHQEGGFCQQLDVPVSNLLAVGELAPASAALLEPFSISAHAVRRAQVIADDQLLVVGAGPIGLGVAAIAAASGAQVVVADTSAERRQHVTQRLALPVIDPLQADFTAQLRGQFGGKLAAKVIDATGNPSSMNGTVDLIRHGGSITFVGLHKGVLVLKDSEIHKKEATLYASRNATRDDFEQVRQLMAQGKISAEMMLNKRLAFSTLVETFEPEVINDRQLIKAVIEFA